MKPALDVLFLILAFGGITQGPFVALLLNSRSVRKSRANLFLSILLIALSFSVFHIVFAGRVIKHLSADVLNAGDPTFLLIAPLLWFYVKALMGNTFSWKMSLHFIPFFVLICISLLFKYVPSTSTLRIFIEAHPNILAIIFWMVAFIQFSIYLFFIHKKWLAYQKLIEQEVSNTEDVNISWVRFFMGVFVIINLFFLLNLVVVLHVYNMNWIYKNIAMLFSLSVFALGYKGILQREIFFPEMEKRETPGVTTVNVIQQSDLNKELINKLLLYIEDKKPYLDPELSLSTLARQMEITRGQLSQLINEGIGDNFYNFINKYRVEQVKKFMNDASMKHYSLLGLALEAGFKSKSTFNLIFKRFTGLTPTEYRKNLAP